MDNHSHFRSLDELIRGLDRERVLLKEMFAKRKTYSFRYDVARELAVKKEESLDFLRRNGVIRNNGEFVELEDVYLKFFEEVLEVNEEINVASVKQSIDNLNENIEYYLMEKSPAKKHSYLTEVKRILHTIALNILRSVIDLKRNIDSTYKNEPTLAIKKKKLENLDEKRKDIAVFIKECEKVIEEKQPAFFLEAMDVQLNETVTNVKYQMNEAYHNLIELDRQIINYLNLIAYQDRLLKKVQKLKYLKDQLILDTNTNIRSMLGQTNPVWMEPRPKYMLKVSIPMLRNTDEGLRILQKVAAGKGNSRLKKGELAEPLTLEDLQVEAQVRQTVDASEVKNAFMASSDNLFHFVMNYSNYRKSMDEEEKLVLFCQIATQYLDELAVEDNYQTMGNIEYPLIYSKQN